jgi:hypothetical protein
MMKDIFDFLGDPHPLRPPVVGSFDVGSWRIDCYIAGLVRVRPLRSLTRTNRVR